MAFPVLKQLLLIISMILISVKAQYNIDQSSFQMMSTDQGHEWAWPMSACDDELDVDDQEKDQGGGIARRSLYSTGKHYYISYGALSANRVPCPARSGRSYYTHHCYNAGGHVNPYTRGCSRITRCRR